MACWHIYNPGYTTGYENASEGVKTSVGAAFLPVFLFNV